MTVRYFFFLTLRRGFGPGSSQATGTSAGSSQTSTGSDLGTTTGLRFARLGMRRRCELIVFSISWKGILPKMRLRLRVWRFQKRDPRQALRMRYWICTSGRTDRRLCVHHFIQSSKVTWPLR